MATVNNETTNPKQICLPVTRNIFISDPLNFNQNNKEAGVHSFKMTVFAL